MPTIECFDGKSVDQWVSKYGSRRAANRFGDLNH